jgi:predicted dithiol-disulfide oxidoreductase (DUF899 family)
MFIDQVGHPAHLQAREVTFAITSRAPFEKLERFRRRLGWEHPWYSWGGGDFGVDFGTSPAEPKQGAYQDGEGFGLSVFLREDGDAYRTYFTKSRGRRSAARRPGRTHRPATRRTSPIPGGAVTTNTRRSDETPCVNPSR